ncbi:MAG: hypothetical protein ABFC18_03450 [Rikenellaceae bacterium]
MKKYLIIIFLVFAFKVNASTYYVAASGGSDSNPGTIGSPWATWQKAFNTADAGDTVYFRGGVWYPTTTYNGYAITEIDPNGGIGHNGTYSNPICFFAYPADYAVGNFPILDCRNVVNNIGHIGININEATYLKFKGLTIRHVRMISPTANCSGIEQTIHSTPGAVISYENMVVHNVGGAGYWLAGYDTLYLKNCDVYNCCDSLDATSPGGDGDGYNVTSGGTDVDTFKVAYIEGCRAWHVSDDGWDLSSSKQFHVSDCWAWNIGYMGTDYGGDANAFKLANSNILNMGKRVIRNCIMTNSGCALNTANIQDPYYGPRLEYYNNSMYDNIFSVFAAVGGFQCSTGRMQEIHRNNLIYLNTGTYYSLFMSCNYTNDSITLDHCSWNIKDGYPYWELNPAFNVTADDFVSLDTAQLRGARKPDGSLPDITFMKLVSTTDLIDGGVDVGLPYNDAAPDLGYAEYGEPDEPEEPIVRSTVSTYKPRWLTNTTATTGGNVIDDGGGIISERGICWNTTGNPTTADNKQSYPSGGTGSFTIIMTGLSKSESYYVRAYAINQWGTSYGNQMTFRTQFLKKNGKILTSNGKILIVD